MKRVKFLISLVAIILLVTNCTRDNTPATKSSKLAVDVTSVSKNVTLKSVDAVPSFELITFKINISDVVVEENSGNDVEQNGNYNDGGNDNASSDSSSESSNGDIVLSGPFIIDVINGTANLGEADVYPGTFKKVDFTFLSNADTEFGGHSIMLSGNYTTMDGTVIPVTLKSSFDQQVQIALANGGVSVQANSKVTLSIVLDAQTWVESIDLANATVSNNEIIIDENNNSDLLTQFNTNLLSKVAVED